MLVSNTSPLLNLAVVGRLPLLRGQFGEIWFVEGLIALGAVALFRQRGIEVDRIFQRVSARKNREGIEIDILTVDQEYVVLIEAKIS